MATVDVDLPHVKDEDPHHHGPAKGWVVGYIRQTIKT